MPQKTETRPRLAPTGLDAAMPPADQRVDLAPQYRQLDLRAETWNDEARTIEVVWSTGARVVRIDWENLLLVDEELDMGSQAVRLDRLNAGAPVLNAHQAYELENQIGVVEPGSVRLEGGRGMATLRLSSRAEVAGLVQDIRDGIIRNISIGYLVHRYEIEKRDGQRDLYRAVDWEPHEISFVPVPADAGAQARSDARQGGVPCILSRAAPAMAAPAYQEVRMEPNDLPAGPEAPAPETRAAPVAPTAPAPAPETVGAARVMDAARRAQLVDAAVCELLLAHDAAPFTEERLMAEIGRRWAARDEATYPVRAVTRVLVDEREKLRDAAVEAVTHRGLGSRAGQFAAGGERFRGMSLVEMGCELEGINPRGKTRAELASLLLRGTHVSGDFPQVLGNAANKFSRRAYEAAPRSFGDFVNTRTVPDFKSITVAALGDAPVLERIREGGEIRFGTIGEESEIYQLITWGRAVTVTRQMLVNDDLGEFSRLSTAFGRRAAEVEADLVYTTILMGNPNMRVGGALFQAAAARGNNFVSTGTALTVDNLAIAEQRMMDQVGIDGARLNLRPRFLVVGSARKVAAQQVTASVIVPNTTSAVNPFAGQLEVRVDSRITGNTWFLIADPQLTDTIELAYLEGREGPVIEEFATVEHDGISFRCLHDVGAAPIDYRGLFRNNGA